MTYARFSSVAACCLAIAILSSAQEKVGPIVSISDLPDKVDQQQVELYLNKIEQEIGKCVAKYPQLSSWELKAVGGGWPIGKRRGLTTLVYSHGTQESNSSNYLDRFGPEGFYFNVRIYSQRQSAMLSGQGVMQVVYGSPLAGGRLFADIASANPKVPELEKLITDIIKQEPSRSPC